jgi:hypothetical protein
MISPRPISPVASTFQPVVGPVFYPLVYTGWGLNPLAALCAIGSLDGFDVKGKIVVCHLSVGSGRNITWTMVIIGSPLGSWTCHGRLLLLELCACKI